MNLDQLLEKAKWSCLTSQELSEVAQRIEKSDDSNTHELYTLLHIIGKDPHGIHYRSLIEKYLIFPKDPMIARLALMILCNYWDLTEAYLEILIIYLKGVDWDSFEDVRLIAISSAGEYVQKTKNKELVRLILQIYENQQEEILTRCVAYGALLRCIGLEWIEIPSPAYLTSHLDEYESPIVLENIRNILKDKK